MKTKKISKKIGLKKNTVSNLNNPYMKAIRGGAPWTSVGVLNKCYTMCDTGVCCPTLPQQTIVCCAVQVSIDQNCDTEL